MYECTYYTPTPYLTLITHVYMYNELHVVDMYFI